MLQKVYTGGLDTGGWVWYNGSMETRRYTIELSEGERTLLEIVCLKDVDVPKIVTRNSRRLRDEQKESGCPRLTRAAQETRISNVLRTVLHATRKQTR